MHRVLFLALCFLLGTAGAATVKKAKTLNEGSFESFTFTSPSTLTVCAKTTDLSSATQFQLIFNIGSSDPVTEINAPGVLKTRETKCAVFDVSSNFDDLLQNEHEYEMYAYTTNRKEGFHARALLTIPDGNVDVVKVYGGCLNGVPALYRVSGTFTDCPLDSNIPDACYTDDTNLVNGGSKCDDVQNELTSGDTDETITVCQPSSIGSYTDVAETGSEAIKFLQYPSKAATPSNPALSVSNDAATDSVELVLLDSDGQTPKKAYSCSAELLCDIDPTDFTASTDVIKAVIVNVDGQNVATKSIESEIQDIKLNWYFADPYVEFSLNKIAYGEEKYTTSQHIDDDTQINKSTLDCTFVIVHGKCFGFLDPEDSNDKGYLSVSLEGQSQEIRAPFSKTDDVLP